MMMKMLEAGGLEPVTDGIRSADDDNPKGYYELEAVKRTKDDPTWVPNARGKVVKVISQLLQDLRRGEGKAADELLPLVYDQLRGLAAARMAQEKPGQTLNATALVHEAFV